MQDKLILLAKLLKELKGFIDDKDANFMWTQYDDADEIIHELDDYILKLIEGDVSQIKNLTLLFLPTSDLQELSINNGWSDKYLEIAGKFDKIIRELKTSIR